MLTPSTPCLLSPRSLSILYHISMKISFIGSGNVATHLACGLHRQGHQIVQVWSREMDHAEILANRVFAEPIDQLHLLYPTADVYILAVSDDALFDMALDLRLRNAIVLHTSGSVAMSVLRPISRHHGVVWAPQTFHRDSALELSSVPFCIEASDPLTQQTIEAMVGSVSQQIYHIDSDQRRLAHLASVMANNFGNAFNALSQEMLAQEGIPFEILRPIISTTAQHALCPTTESLWQLQTGPAVRHDQKTIDAHRRMLADQPAVLALYDAMSVVIELHVQALRAKK